MDRDAWKMVKYLGAVIMLAFGVFWWRAACGVYAHFDVQLGGPPALHFAFEIFAGFFCFVFASALALDAAEKLH